VRLIVRKVYRVFPELDRFSDAECEGFVGLVARRHRLARFFVSLTLAIVGGILFLGGSFLSSAIGEVWSRSGDAPAFVEDGWHLLVGIIASVVGAMYFTSAARNAWLRGKIQEHLTTIECMGCEYPLLGLPVVGGGITCPECGQRFDLAARGLSAADVLSGTASKSET